MQILLQALTNAMKLNPSCIIGPATATFRQMGRFLLMTLVITLLTSSAFAQFGGGGGQRGPGGGREQMDPEKMASRTTERMKERLKLNENQEASVQALNLERFLSMKDTYKKAMDAGDMSLMREEAMKSEAKFEEGLKVVLNATQFKDYTAWKEEQMKQRQERMQQRQMGGGQME